MIPVTVPVCLNNRRAAEAPLSAIEALVSEREAMRLVPMKHDEVGFFGSSCLLPVIGPYLSRALSRHFEFWGPTLCSFSAKNLT
jgi:hypothetical protein